MIIMFNRHKYRGYQDLELLKHARIEVLRETLQSHVIR